MIAKLISVERADTTCNVMVEYSDTNTGFSQRHPFNFQNMSELTVQQIRDEVLKVGAIYKAINTKEATLKAAIGTEITI